MNQDQLKQNWINLPERIREMLSSEDTVEKIEDIAKKAGLPEMEQGFLVRITANLMRGIITPEVFIGTISDELDIPKELASKIAQEINHQIFNSIKDALKIVHSSSAPIVKPKPVTAVAPLDPSLVTCLPSQMSPEAAKANKAPGNAAAGNIFEQKLGSAFRMKGENVSSVGVISPTIATPIPPLAPTAGKVTTPTPPSAPAARMATPPPPPPTPASPPKPAFDPYRERPV